MAIGATAAMLAGYEFADIGSGVFHWYCDNYGSGKTPILGKQIVAFQGHHKKPWTITHRDTANNIAPVCQVTLVPLLGLLMFSKTLPPLFVLWGASSIGFINLAQEIHKLAHTNVEELPFVFRWLQDNNVLLSRKAHGIHHKKPHDNNYCIVSGHMNVVDRYGFFTWL